MHSSFLAIFLSATTASAVLNLRASTFNQLVGRQAIPITTCFGSAPSTEPNPCEYICGEGSRQCVSEGHCFNPTKGETCCEDGTYCPANSYCSNAGCCDEGLSLEECGAVRTIGTLAGDYFETSTSSSVVPEPTPYETTTSEEVEPTFTPSAYESTSTIIEPAPTPYSSSFSSKYVEPTSYSPPVYSTSASSSIDVTILPTIPAYPSSTTSNETNATLPSYTPAQQTTNAGFKHEVAGWTIGGMAALGMGFFL
ncbi:putative secreted protein [Pseudocercospora fuligena]|uniref:Putative secreted protein n=1 Tax=Pseudocercospora fuligena TaxID=685502 RepID=A0A8H6VKU5_9PEZI|nr:putative secreted protein [Pseudocercospora fuligena]